MPAKPPRTCTRCARYSDMSGCGEAGEAWGDEVDIRSDDWPKGAPDCPAFEEVESTIWDADDRRLRHAYAQELEVEPAPEGEAPSWDELFRVVRETSWRAGLKEALVLLAAEGEIDDRAAVRQALHNCAVAIRRALAGKVNP